MEVEEELEPTTNNGLPYIRNFHEFDNGEKANPFLLIQVETEDLAVDGKVKIFAKVCEIETYLDMWLINKLLEDYYF
jgi:hypothetical protein